MKNKILTIAALLAITVFSNNVEAQIKLPQASSAQTIKQGLGVESVTLEYNRPNVNGRKVFGGLIPYNQVWRTGANTIPKLTLEGKTTIGGKVFEAGTYGILTIPNVNEWTIIVTSNANQWGAYKYNQQEDLHRFTVKTNKTTSFVETFTMSFTNVKTNELTLEISWENTKVAFPLIVDQREVIIASIDEAMKGDKKPYFPAAQYYYNNGLDIQKASVWMNEAEKASPDAPHIKYWKAKIQLKAGDKKGAIATATSGIEIAKKVNNAEYVKLNTAVLEEAKK